MFTFADIRNIAVQIEKNGEETYRWAADRAPDPEMAKTLLWLADEERRHGEQLAVMSTSRVLDADQVELEAMGRHLLQDIVRSQTFSLEREGLNEATDLEDLLTQSIGFEEDTIRFYEILGGFLDDAETIRQLEVIIAQERGHVEQLDRIRAQHRGTSASGRDSQCEESGVHRR